MSVLPTLPAGCVDVVCCDPPYGIDYETRRTEGRPECRKRVANDKNPFIWWIGEAARVLNSRGALACFCRWDVQETFRTAIEAAGLTIRSQVVWDRVAHGMGDCQRQFAPQHDVIWFAARRCFAFRGGRPKSVIRCRRPNGQEAQHPTEKPVPLMRELLERLVAPDMLVLDPCTGAGSTGVAAVDLNARFIGVELEKAHCQVARCRFGPPLDPIGRSRS